MEDIIKVTWEVEYSNEFEEWWNALSDASQDSVDRYVRLLEERGPLLGRPHVDTIRGSSYPNMKELRIQDHGSPLRILFAFDPRRVAILLLGDDKSGNP